MIRLRIVMHLKTMKYACKYALKNVKICIKNLKNHLNMHQKSQFSLENTPKYKQTVQNFMTFLIKAKLFKFCWDLASVLIS